MRSDEFSYLPDSFPDRSEIPNHGPTLLNSFENAFLGDFFLGHLPSQHNAIADFDFASALSQSYNHNQDQAHKYHEPLLDWLIAEPPPTLLDAAATPKPPTPPSHNFHGVPTDFNGFSNPGLAAASPTHNELLSAAPILNTGATSPPLNVAPPNLLAAQSRTNSLDSIHVPVATSASYVQPQSAPASSSEFVFGFLKPTNALEPLNTSVNGGHDFNFNGPHSAPALNQSRAEEVTDARLYRFGSDLHFGANGFQPQSEQERPDVIERKLLKDLYLIHASLPTADNTQPPTPEPSQSRKRSATLRDEDDEDDSEDDGMRKRRRASSDDEDSKTPTGRPSHAIAKSRRISATDSTAKRRRPSGSTTKPPRENLTDEQKRNNHIMSEQKRRDLIKRGFEHLHQLVPELRAGGLSKSSVLMEAAGFLEKLVQTNEMLRRRLGKFD